MQLIRPIFFADYRDLHDALESSKQKISVDFLRHFLSARGIFFAASTERSVLIDAVATYAYEYADLEELCDQLDQRVRRDRKANFVLSGAVTPEQIRDAVAKVRRDRKNFGKNESLQTDIQGSAVTLKLDYFDVHTERTALKQMQPRSGEIEVFAANGKTTFRYPANERSAEVIGAIAQALVANQVVPTAELAAVSLAAFDKKKRTEFFKTLMMSVKGYKVIDVKKVNLNSRLSVPDFTGDDDGDTEDDTEDNDDKKEMELEVKTLLNRASLDGSSVMNSTAYKSFLESGFFISRVIWLCKPRTRSSGNPKVEFEALVEDPAEGTNFSYSVRGVHRATRAGAHTKTKYKPKPIEAAPLLLALEDAVKTAFEKTSK